MNEQELKTFIKDNLILSAEFECAHGNSNNITVSIRFKDEARAFTEATVFVPEDKD